MTQLEEAHRFLLHSLDSDSFQRLSELHTESLRIEDSDEVHLNVKVVRRLREGVLKHGNAEKIKLADRPVAAVLLLYQAFKNLIEQKNEIVGDLTFTFLRFAI